MYQTVHGGEGGIRTLESFDTLPVFKTGTFNHSVTSPRRRWRIDFVHQLVYLNLLLDASSQFEKVAVALFFSLEDWFILTDKRTCWKISRADAGL